MITKINSGIPIDLRKFDLFINILLFINSKLLFPKYKNIIVHVCNSYIRNLNI